ncbi:NB-ARC domain-containing protein [Forsythia ovata]|uniref:NB-ARC domain-containing protein n=1 Tax=Forsythia ovata TaxID=205694 RepID=A0ABD1UV56_9LAMI
MDNSIHDISPDTSPKCPRLSSLILSKNYLLKFVPECFFEQMRGLYILNLSETSIEQLPNSISHLEKLNALLLGDCGNLVYVPPLEKLRLLRQLDLTGTSIEEVPKEKIGDDGRDPIANSSVNRTPYEKAKQPSKQSPIAFGWRAIEGRHAHVSESLCRHFQSSERKKKVTSQVCWPSSNIGANAMKSEISHALHKFNQEDG